MAIDLDTAYAALSVAAKAQSDAQQTATNLGTKFAGAQVDLNNKKAATQTARDAFNKALDASLLPQTPAPASPVAATPTVGP